MSKAKQHVKPEVFTREETATVLAALRFWQANDMCNPNNRINSLHDIATNCGDLTSLDESEIDALCEKVNTL